MASLRDHHLIDEDLHKDYLRSYSKIHTKQRHIRTKLKTVSSTYSYLAAILGAFVLYQLDARYEFSGRLKIEKMEFDWPESIKSLTLKDALFSYPGILLLSVILLFCLAKLKTLFTKKKAPKSVEWIDGYDREVDGSCRARGVAPQLEKSVDAC